MTELDPRLDDHACFLSITAGPGRDGQDWAGMLRHQYRRFAERRRFQVRDVFVRSAEHGVERATLQIEGENCARLLAGEAGVHRLVRVSPFGTSPRRYSAFAAIGWFPVVLDPTSVALDEADLRVDFEGWCGVVEPDTGGPGRPIRITHVPTGIVAESSSGTKTEIRDAAMRVMRAMVFAVRVPGEQPAGSGEVRWGGTSRSYVLTPYELVKDERTQVQTEDVTNVLDGGLDPFVGG
jgi:peptide chain release factor 2